METIAREGIELFQSRGFKLRKWVTNGHAKSVLRQVPQCDYASSIGKIDIGSQPLPDSTALGLSWDPESDTLKISGRTFVEAATRRKMASQLASQFDPLGIVAPLLLGGKLILQKVTATGVDWDNAVSDEVKKDWKKWLETSNILNEFCIPRNFLLEHTELRNDAEYQLHGFCDVSDSAFSCAIYLRGVSAAKAQVSFAIGKSKLVLTHQKGWVISRKELEAAKMLSELIVQTSKALHDLNCKIFCWTDSQVVFKWIVNPDLSLARFVKRRVDRILLVVPASCWNYVNTSLNPADVGTRAQSSKQPSLLDLWLKRPSFLLQEQVNARPPEHLVVMRRTLASSVDLSSGDAALDRLIEASPSLYTLKKRSAYPAAFSEFVVAKAEEVAFQKPVLNARWLDKAFVNIVKYVQSQRFGAAVKLLSKESPDEFESIKRLGSKTNDPESKRRLNELKTLRNLRPSVDLDNCLRIEGRLENADLPLDSKHPLILPGRHPLTGLIVQYQHEQAGHGGPAYTLMKTRKRFWIIHGISSVKFYIANCGKCALLKAKPVRQLMADLPSCRVAVCNKPFKFTGLDFSTESQ